MPTMAQLAELASQMYVGNPTIGAKQDKGGIQYDPNSPVSKALGLTPSFFLWAGEESSSYDAYYRGFYTRDSYWYNPYRNGSHAQAVCLGE